jgi:hypothetical protein
MHLEVIGCEFTASAVAGSVALICAGDSFTIKNAKPDSKILLVDVIALWGTLGEFRVVGPHFNDTTQGIRVPVIPAISSSLLASPVAEPLWPQDTLAVTFFGTAAGGEINVAGIVVWYEDLPGISATMLDTAGLRQRGVRVVPVAINAIATVATGEWGGAEALNGDTDLLKPNTDYALLGAASSLVSGVIGVRSPNWGNVRVGIPGQITVPDVSWNYLVHLSDRLGLPCIPVLNSGNKASTFIDVLQDEAGANPDVKLNLVELAP